MVLDLSKVCIEGKAPDITSTKWVRIKELRNM